MVLDFFQSYCTAPSRAESPPARTAEEVALDLYADADLRSKRREHLQAQWKTNQENLEAWEKKQYLEEKSKQKALTKYRCRDARTLAERNAELLRNRDEYERISKAKARKREEQDLSECTFKPKIHGKTDLYAKRRKLREMAAYQQELEWLIRSTPHADDAKQKEWLKHLEHIDREGASLIVSCKKYTEIGFRPKFAPVMRQLVKEQPHDMHVMPSDPTTVSKDSPIVIRTPYVPIYKPGTFLTSNSMIQPSFGRQRTMELKTKILPAKKVDEHLISPAYLF